MTPTSSRQAPTFWRCSRCNTPNPSASYLTRCLGCGRPVPPFPTSEPTSTPVAEPASTTSIIHPTRGRKTLIASTAYAVIVVVVIGMIRGLSLEWWVVGPLLFVPRSIFLLPIVPLAIGAFRARRSILVAVVVAETLLVLGPLMGFSIPMSRRPSHNPVVRVLSIDLTGSTLDEDRLVVCLKRHAIDVVCFQGLDARSGIVTTLTEAGWHFDRDRRVASRFVMVKELGGSGDSNAGSMSLFRVKLKHPDGFDFVVGSVRMPDPLRAFDRRIARDRGGFREALERWDEELIQLRESLADTGSTPLIVAGNFQVPGDYARMTSLRSTYPSAHEQAGWGSGATWPTAWPWVRTDHVIASRDWSFTRSWVGPDLGSNHRPVFAEAVVGDRKSSD